MAKHGPLPSPSFDCWTDDALQYGGTSTSCWAQLSGGIACPADRPMRVCKATPGPDPEGNTCGWNNCGWNTATPLEYFGGCINDPTAGTLCCR